VPGTRSLNLGKKKKYTIVEGIKIFEITNVNKQKLKQKGSSFWAGVASKNILPERGHDSMKQFWKRYEHLTLEQYLVQCIVEKIDYCLSYS
jgi:hypothetical protein